jgi:hypothetical protein
MINWPKEFDDGQAKLNAYLEPGTSNEYISRLQKEILTGI